MDHSQGGSGKPRAFRATARGKVIPSTPVPLKTAHLWLLGWLFHSSISSGADEGEAIWSVPSEDPWRFLRSASPSSLFRIPGEGADHLKQLCMDFL